MDQILVDEVKEMSVEQTEIKESRVIKIQDRLYIGSRQIGSTIKFEFKRNTKSLLIATVASVFVYLLMFIIDLIQQNRGVELPDSNVDYLTGTYFSMLFPFLVIIIAVTLGASIICEDFQKDTGNLIFPKTTKFRLLTGRLFARFLYAILAVTVFYLLAGITTLIYYGTVSTMIFASWGLALLYTLAVFSVVVFFSSFMKNNAGTIILSILLMLIVFSLVDSILVFTGSQLEPLFILTYYSNILTEIFDMPTDRFVESTFGAGRPGGGEGITIFQWITPSIGGAIAGMLIYTTLLLSISYILFRFRQKK